jgi:hypothetical protein
MRGIHGVVRVWLLAASLTDPSQIFFMHYVMTSVDVTQRGTLRRVSGDSGR